MSEDLRRFTRYGVKQSGVNNKYYEVEAVENEDGTATWIFRWARIGYECSKPKTGRAFSFERAVEICEEQWKKKSTGRNPYVEKNAMEALALAVQDLDERHTRGLSAVEIETPCFHAGKSEKRCRQFCEKWLAKFNLVRRSKFDLGNEYEKQIEIVLKGYAAEWARICKTKAHGHLADNAHAQTAYRIFFGEMKDLAACCVWVYMGENGSLY